MYNNLFSQLTQRAGNFLVSRQSETNFKWEDLKGKSVIGGRLGGMPELVLEYVLKENDLKIGEDVELINNLSFSSTAGAFVSGIGDYTVEFEPTATTLEEQENGYIVASLGTASGYVPYTVYMATSDYIKNNPETVQKFTNAIYKGQIWVNNHSASEIAEVIAPQFQENDLKSLTKIIERYKEQDTWNTTPIFNQESLNLIEDILEEGGELEQRVPYDNFINMEFSNKAIELIKE